MAESRVGALIKIRKSFLVLFSKKNRRFRLKNDAKTLFNFVPHR
jgi:hypothetical protein